MIQLKKALMAATFTMSLLSLNALADTDEQAPLNPSQVKQVKEIVHDYLVTSPEVLVEASHSLQKKQMEEAEKEASQAIKTHFKELTQDPQSPVLGNPKGNVILVEFLDYQCGHCKSMSPVVSELIKSNKDLRVVIKELPIFGPSSNFAALAAIASTKQGQDKFQAFHKALFEAQTRFNKKFVLNLAQKADLNIDQLKKDMETTPVKNELENNLKLAQALRLVGTPAFIITNQNGSKTSFIPGVVKEPQKQFQMMIDKARKAG